MSRSSLQRAYGIWAPIYDQAVRGFSEPLRQRSLRQIPQNASCQILIDGIGTGLDIPFLPNHCTAIGIDLTHAMLRRAQNQPNPIPLVQADAEVLPFANATFDFVVMHLILAVVPNAGKALAEASRVLKPGGRILLLDKFLRPGQKAWIRRALGRVAGAVATHTDLTFEEILAERPELHCMRDEPGAMGGWFRLITLEKTA